MNSTNPIIKNKVDTKDNKTKNIENKNLTKNKPESLKVVPLSVSQKNNETKVKKNETMTNSTSKNVKSIAKSNNKTVVESQNSTQAVKSATKVNRTESST